MTTICFCPILSCWDPRSQMHSQIISFKVSIFPFPWDWLVSKCWRRFGISERCLVCSAELIVFACTIHFSFSSMRKSMITSIVLIWYNTCHALLYYCFNTIVQLCLSYCHSAELSSPVPNYLIKRAEPATSLASPNPPGSGCREVQLDQQLVLNEAFFEVGLWVVS